MTGNSPTNGIHGILKNNETGLELPCTLAYKQPTFTGDVLIDGTSLVNVVRPNEWTFTPDKPPYALPTEDGLYTVSWPEDDGPEALARRRVFRLCRGEWAELTSHSDVAPPEKVVALLTTYEWQLRRLVAAPQELSEF